LELATFACFPNVAASAWLQKGLTHESDIRERLFVPATPFGIDYFNGLANHLGAGPHVTLFPPFAPLASSHGTGTQARDEIQRGFPQGPVHIIAHSMGGLDSRHLIAANHQWTSPIRDASYR